MHHLNRRCVQREASAILFLVHGFSSLSPKSSHVAPGTTTLPKISPGRVVVIHTMSASLTTGSFNAQIKTL